jgi:hypothetical protein
LQQRLCRNVVFTERLNVQEPSAMELLPLKLLPRVAENAANAPPLWADYILPWLPPAPAAAQKKLA